MYATLQSMDQRDDGKEEELGSSEPLLFSPFPSNCLLHPAGYEEDYGKVSNNPASIWPNSLLSFL